jgi:hypothetical protein
LRPGWSVLFEATWVAHAPEADAAAAVEGGTDAHWAPVVDAETLDKWAMAWGDDDEPLDIWRPEILDQDVIVLAGRRDGHVVAGSVVNVAADVVGLSNLFGSDPDVDPWRSSVAWIAEHLAGRPIVGYESGDDLTAALDHGFEPIGPLRIWTRDVI